jgi:hypothetical protein
MSHVLFGGANLGMFQVLENELTKNGRFDITLKRPLKIKPIILIPF